MFADERMRDDDPENATEGHYAISSFQPSCATLISPTCGNATAVVRDGELPESLLVRAFLALTTWVLGCAESFADG